MLIVFNSADDVKMDITSRNTLKSMQPRIYLFFRFDVTEIFSSVRFYLNWRTITRVFPVN